MKPALSAVALLLLTVQFAAGAMEIGSRRQLFVDGALIETSRGCALRMHAPVPREVVFRFDAPWEGPESGYVTVLRDGEELRMYYRGGGELSQEVTCMATSRDGVRWERPKLGLFEFRGSRQNNIVFDPTSRRKSYAESHNFTPFLDTNPDVKPAERYKAVALGWYEAPNRDKSRALVVLASPDGIHWSSLAKDAVMTSGSFDSQNVAFWDTNRRCYACYSRIGRGGFRSVQVSTSTDFLKWSEPTMLDFGGTPLEHFYTNAISQYFREPSLYLGFPMRFVPQRKAIGAERREIDGVSDGVFISSHDGINFDRAFMEAFIRPGPDPNNWGKAHGNNTPAWGLVPSSAAEMSIYWAENYVGVPQMRRGTLRTDGFASVGAGSAGGEFVTPPLRFVGAKLLLNYSTSAVGSIGVEVQDVDGKSLPGFAMVDGGEIYGDEISREFAWRGGDPGKVEGRPVRLRFLLRDADLYSFVFSDKAAD